MSPRSATRCRRSSSTATSPRPGRRACSTASTPPAPDVQGLLAGWRQFAEGVAALSFAVMFFAFIVQVVSRYIFNAPVAWTLELCAISYVWVVFWTCDILVTERQQIVFDVIYNWFRPGPRRWIAIFNTASLGLVFLAALPGV